MRGIASERFIERLSAALLWSLVACQPATTGPVPGDADAGEDVASVNQAPAASIASHGDGATLTAGAWIDFSGVVSDADHGPTDLRASWLTDRRTLCPPAAPDEAGLTTCRAMLEEGEAALTLRVRDVAGAVTEVSLAITVLPEEPVVDPPTGYALTFQVDMEGYAGSVTVGNSVQGWETAGEVQLVDPDGDGIYVGSLRLEAGTFIEYKFVRGPNGSGLWEEVPLACGLQAGDYVNRFLTMPAADHVLPVTRFGGCPTGTNAFVCDGEPGRPVPVTVQGRQILVGQAPIHLKGVCWAPTPLGSGPGFDNGFATHAAQDASLMADAGVNVVRTYGPITDVAVLDTLWSHGIHVLMTVYYGYSDTPESAVAHVCALKGHPAILGWLVGNEWNYNTLGRPISLAEATRHVADAVTAIQDNDPSRPVGTVYGWLPDAGVLAELAHVDLWGLNVYSGAGFGSLFGEWAARSTRPMFLGEYGSDAWDARVGAVNEGMQADIVASLTQEIHAHASVSGAGVCAGGMVFEFNDEWWKHDGGSWSDHDTGPSWTNAAYPDPAIQEEWWGLVDIDRLPRAAWWAYSAMTPPDAASPP